MTRDLSPKILDLVPSGIDQNVTIAAYLKKRTQSLESFLVKTINLEFVVSNIGPRTYLHKQNFTILSSSQLELFYFRSKRLYKFLFINEIKKVGQMERFYLFKSYLHKINKITR